MNGSGGFEVWMEQLTVTRDLIFSRACPYTIGRSDAVV